MPRIYRLAASLFLLSLVATAQQPVAKSPFDQIKFLIGHWQGSTQGEPGKGKGERSYEFVLRGKFIRGTINTIYPPKEKNLKGEVHEDVGFFSFDRKQKKLVLRQFTVKVL